MKEFARQTWLAINFMEIDRSAKHLGVGGGEKGLMFGIFLTEKTTHPLQSQIWLSFENMPNRRNGFTCGVNVEKANISIFIVLILTVM